MTELELIARLIPTLPGNPTVVAGAGDDCAVLDMGLPGQFLLFKTDAVVEGIHFTAATQPEQVGHKALARCLSDVAAMAGTPSHALVTLALPARFDPEFVDGVYRGMSRLAERYRVAIVGGETTTNPERILISVCLLGKVPKGKCLMRSGAKSGDGIFVTGSLGGSIEGKHLEFEPRIAEAQWLAEHFDVHCMMDLSDGLATDLRHLLEASGVGAEVLASAIPISQAARRRRRGLADDSAQENAATEKNKTPLQAALTDGEDFELIFTLSSSDAVPLIDAWKKQFPELQIRCIGKITARPGLLIRDKAGMRPMPEHGYVHFS